MNQEPNHTHPLIVYFSEGRSPELTAICNARLRVWWKTPDGRTAFMYQVYDGHYPGIVEKLKAAGFEYQAWDLEADNRESPTMDH